MIPQFLFSFVLNSFPKYRPNKFSILLRQIVLFRKKAPTYWRYPPPVFLYQLFYFLENPWGKKKLLNNIFFVLTKNYPKHFLEWKEISKSAKNGKDIYFCFQENTSSFIFVDFKLIFHKIIFSYVVVKCVFKKKNNCFCAKGKKQFSFVIKKTFVSIGNFEKSNMNPLGFQKKWSLFPDIRVLAKNKKTTN